METDSLRGQLFGPPRSELFSPTAAGDPWTQSLPQRLNLTRDNLRPVVDPGGFAEPAQPLCTLLEGSFWTSELPQT